MPQSLADACVLRNLIDAQAAALPDKPFIFFPDGESWDRAELRRRVRRTAKGLQDLGVRQGETVLAWLPNGPAAVEVMFAVNYLGAVCVPVGIGLRGAPLDHIVADSGAALMVADARLLPRWQGDGSAVTTVVAVGDPQAEPENVRLHTAAAIFAATGEPAPPQRPISPRDTQCVLYTSGTTGPAKGVLSSYLHRYAHAVAVPQITAEDRRLVQGPMSHTGGFGSIFGSLATGGSVVLTEGFRTETFWETVSRFEATVTSLLGAMLPFLLGRPPTAGDRDHTLRTALIAPVDACAMEFSDRFGVPVYGIYNMTELSVPLMCGPDIDRDGLCGHARAGYEVMVVDQDDQPVPDGAAGELVVRNADPWTMSRGYLANPEATAKAWRNGWFHTGDLFRRDPDGAYVYLDRLKDAVRRRGENISSFEVENEILKFPGIREAAVVGVPSDISEEEVLAVLSLRADAAFDPVALTEFLIARMAHYMVPRYIRVMEDLPHTPTQKVQKQALRQEGVTPDTWDREAVMGRLRREALG